MIAQLMRFHLQLRLLLKKTKREELMSSKSRVAKNRRKSLKQIQVLKLRILRKTSDMKRRSSQTQIASLRMKRFKMSLKRLKTKTELTWNSK
jgi:hypothetical protein